MADVNSFLQYLTGQTNFQPLINASNQAANIQANAANTATNQSIAGLQQALQALQSGNTNANSVLNPLNNQVQGAATGLSNLVGLSGDPTAQLAALQNTPGFQFALQQTMDAVNRQASAKGKNLSGQTLQELQDRALGLASTTFQNQVQNQQGFLNSLSPFASQLANSETNYGINSGNILSNIGQTQGAGTLAAAGARAQGLLNAANAQVAQSTASGIPNGVVASPGYTYGGVIGSPSGSNPNSLQDLLNQLQSNSAGTTSTGSSGGGGGGGTAGGGSGTGSTLSGGLTSLTGGTTSQPQGSSITNVLPSGGTSSISNPYNTLDQLAPNGSSSITNPYDTLNQLPSDGTSSIPSIPPEAPIPFSLENLYGALDQTVSNTIPSAIQSGLNSLGGQPDTGPISANISGFQSSTISNIQQLASSGDKQGAIAARNAAITQLQNEMNAVHASGGDIGPLALAQLAIAQTNI